MSEADELEKAVSFRQHIDQLLRLSKLDNESPEAETLRDEMDDTWKKCSSQEHDLLRDVSTALNQADELERRNTANRVMRAIDDARPELEQIYGPMPDDAVFKLHFEPIPAPTEPGWWWYHDSKQRQPLKPRLVLKNGASLSVFNLGEFIGLDWPGQWYGPRIPEPRLLPEKTS